MQPERRKICDRCGEKKQGVLQVINKKIRKDYKKLCAPCLRPAFIEAM